MSLQRNHLSTASRRTITTRTNPTLTTISWRVFLFFFVKVAVQFADLHDTPGRMEARGAVRKVVPWSESRSFFFWRLRRRLAEFDLRKQVICCTCTALLLLWLINHALGRGSIV